MTLRTETGLNYKIDNFFFNIRQNMLHSDIQDIEHGINVLTKDKTFWQRFNRKMYMAEMNTSYNVKENLEIMNLLINQKKEIIDLRLKHKYQIHLLNEKFTKKDV